MTDLFPNDEVIGRVAVLAPTSPDAQLCKQILDQAQIDSEICGDVDRLCTAINSGVGVGLVPESQLDQQNLQKLKNALQNQPAWSDFPVLVLVGTQQLSSQRLNELLSLGNVTLVPCPIRVAVFVSKVRARLRDRRRQCIVRDLLIERQAAADAAALDSRRLRMALQAGQMGVWEWSKKELYWSARIFQLFGFDASLSPNMGHWFERVHKDDRGELMERWHRSIAEGTDLQMEFRIDHPQLGERWLSAIGEPLRGSSGRAIRLAGIVWDVTDRNQTEASLREAQERAEAANRSKSEFLANMSHEIRTPMAAILGYTELFAEELDRAAARNYIATIRRNGLYLLEIINDILDLSKIEAGKFELLIESFSPIRLVEDVHSIMDVRATEKDIALCVEYEGDVPALISADLKRLKQILINLIGNAIKFTNEGAVTLTVGHDPATNQIRFQIEDTGIGMTKLQIERLFQPFTQVDTSETRQYEGTGLGLAISRRIAHMMGGEITVVSEAGVGSCFTATINAGDVSSAQSPILHQSSDAVDPSVSNDDILRSSRILVVDDRRDIRFLASRLLGKAGAEIMEAEDGQEAVDAMEELIEANQSVDLILLDMQMPRLDGYRTAEQLRQMGFRGPIIALTAAAMQGDMDRCIECGCNEYLSKPIDSAMLLESVQRLLARRHPT